MTPVRVLLADDHAAIRAGLRLMLEQSGDVEVVGEASDGDVAVRQARALRPDVVLMDVRMPVMDGLSATRAIRALDHPDAKTVPIIAMTANVFDEDVQRSLEAGMNAHLSKPIEPDRLFETMAGFVREERDQG